MHSRCQLLRLERGAPRSSALEPHEEGRRSECSPSAHRVGLVPTSPDHHVPAAHSGHQRRADQRAHAARCAGRSQCRRPAGGVVYACTVRERPPHGLRRSMPDVVVGTRPLRAAVTGGRTYRHPARGVDPLHVAQRVHPDGRQQPVPSRLALLAGRWDTAPSPPSNALDRSVVARQRRALDESPRHAGKRLRRRDYHRNDVCGRIARDDDGQDRLRYRRSVPRADAKFAGPRVPIRPVQPLSTLPAGEASRRPSHHRARWPPTESRVKRTGSAHQTDLGAGPLESETGRYNGRFMSARASH